MYTIVYSALGANVFSGRGGHLGIFGKSRDTKNSCEGDKGLVMRNAENPQWENRSAGMFLIKFHTTVKPVLSGPQLSGHSFY